MEKELFVNKIVTSMSTMLDGAQLKMLQSVVEQSLMGMTLVCNGDIERKEKPSSHYIELFLAAKKLEGCSQQTIRLYSYELKKLSNSFKDSHIHILPTESLRKYLAEIQYKGHCGSVTLDNIRRILSSFYGWLETEDYIVKNPMKRIHRVKPPKTVKKAFSEEEMQQLKSCTEGRNRAIIEFLYATGIRVGELVALNRDNVNLSERTCIVTGKGNIQREVYFSIEAKVILEKYLRSRRDTNQALFVTERQDRRLGISGIETIMRKIGMVSGIENVHPHRFRRTMATHALCRGMHIEEVQKLLGHVRIDTTLRYSIVDQQNVKVAYKKIF